MHEFDYRRPVPQYNYSDDIGLGAAALALLNTAWNTSYTTWDTAGGWGQGSGWMVCGWVWEEWGCMCACECVAGCECGWVCRVDVW